APAPAHWQALPPSSLRLRSLLIVSPANQSKTIKSANLRRPRNPATQIQPVPVLKKQRSIKLGAFTRLGRPIAPSCDLRPATYDLRPATCDPPVALTSGPRPAAAYFRPETERIMSSIPDDAPSLAKRSALRIARASLLPCAIVTTPFTPRSGTPPYVPGSILSRICSSAGRRIVAASL